MGGGYNIKTITKILDKIIAHPDLGGNYITVWKSIKKQQAFVLSIKNAMLKNKAKKRFLHDFMAIVFVFCIE